MCVCVCVCVEGGGGVTSSSESLSSWARRTLMLRKRRFMSTLCLRDTLFTKLCWNTPSECASVEQNTHLFVCVCMRLCVHVSVWVCVRECMCVYMSVCLTLAMLIICCSESLWMMAFFTTVERMKGNWQKENLGADRGREEGRMRAWRNLVEKTP